MSKISVDFEQMAEITKLMVSASDDLDSTLAERPKNLDGGDFAQVMSLLVTLAVETSGQVSEHQSRPRRDRKACLDRVCGQRGTGSCRD